MRLRLQPTAINQQPLKFLQWEFSIPYNLRNEPGNLAKYDFPFLTQKRKCLACNTTPLFSSLKHAPVILVETQEEEFFTHYKFDFSFYYEQIHSFFFFFVIEKFSE